MAGVFPPSASGGVPASPSVPNYYVPVNPVVGGEGPLWADSGCTTAFTAIQCNSLSAEILAAVDMCGESYDSLRVDNLGTILAALQAVAGLPVGGTPGQALVINAGGVPTWGAPIDGANY
jgi:hypothetical protein